MAFDEEGSRSYLVEVCFNLATNRKTASMNIPEGIKGGGSKALNH